MPFRSDTLSVLAYANGFTLWSYQTPDASATVVAAGYFNAATAMLRPGVVIIAGEKDRPEQGARGAASYHLVERDFGRFARAVRVHVAIDAARATATLTNGELRVRLPKIEERRGQGLLVSITTDAAR